MSRFIHVENMRSILFMLEQELGREAQRAEELSPVKKIVYDIMLDVAREPSFALMDIDDMNRMVVDAAIRYYREMFAVQQLRHQHELQQLETVRYEEPRVSAVPTTHILRPGEHATPVAPALTCPERLRRCISIEGQDRDVSVDPYRYHFTVTMEEALKTVHSLCTAGIVLASQDHTINCAYLLLVIDELPGTYTASAADATRRAFAKLVPKSTYSSPKGRMYVVLESIADDTRDFDPPLNSLSRLTVRLTRPSGAHVSQARDDIKLCKVVQSSDGNWILVTHTFWNSQEFTQGDIVSVKGCNTGLDAFDKFINRVEGHEVITSGRAEADGCNTLIIRCAGSISQETGAFEKDDAMVPAFDGTSAQSESAGEIRVHANILNLSLQMSITLNARCGLPGEGRVFESNVNK